MTFDQRLKIFKRAMARHGLYGSSWLINKLPYGAVRFLSHLFIAIGSRISVKQRRIAFESLNIAFGKEKTPQEIKRIAKDCFENLGGAMIELIYFMEHPALIKEKVSYEGKEHLDRAMKAGKGVVAVSAHFGSFPLMLLKFALEGYKTNAIIRPARDKNVEEYFFDLRSRLGLNTLYSSPRKKCVDDAIKALRNNELVFVPLDQNFGSHSGIFVEFFGQKAATATGPVVFAMRTGATILPVFMVRDHGDRHKILIEPPIEIERREDDKETVQVNITKITQLIEQYIRKYPREWGWMHRRWKTQP